MSLFLQPGETALLAVGTDHPQAELSLENNMVRRSILPSGIRVISEAMPSTRGVSIGVWFARGSRDETKTGLGATHFLEHLLFKGTTRRSAFDIAHAFDAVGGESNAATAKEHTHYYARVLGEDLPMAIEVLLDMVSAPKLDRDAFEMERGVILDELNMGLDDPGEQIHDAFAAHIFSDHPLGRPVGGTIQTVSDLELEALHHHYEAGYTPDRLVVCAAGNVNHDHLCDLVQRQLQRDDSPWAAWQQLKPAPAVDFGKHVTSQMDAWEPPTGASQMQVQKISKAFEQVHIIIGGRCLPAGHPLRPAATVAETILGGGMSSRLFQHVREQRGLAYNTYSFSVSYRDAGQFGVAAACSKQNAPEVAALLQAELEDLAARPVSDQELARVKGQLRGSLSLGMEDSSARMNRLGMSEVILGKYVPLEVTLERIEKVTAGDVQDYARQWLVPPSVQVWLGAV